MSKRKIFLPKSLEIKLCRRFAVNIWFFPVAFCAAAGGYGDLFLLAFLVAFLHEAAHVLCAFFLKVSISHITLLPFGVTARLSSEYIKSSEKEFLIAFSGPFLNVILFWFCSIAARLWSEPLLLFCADVNLAMCAVNLVPALPLDGGRMLKSLLTPMFGIIRAFNFILKLSRILIAALALAGLWILFLGDFNFSLILISAFLIQNLGREQTSLSHITLAEILDASKKLESRRVFRTKVLCVSFDSRASDILRHLSYDYFCIVHVLDRNSHIIKTLTETQILSKLTELGIRTRYGEI